MARVCVRYAPRTRCCHARRRQKDRVKEREKEKNMGIIPNTYFAVSKDGEQQWQTFRYKLLTVVVRTDLKEVLQQLIDDGIESKLMCSSKCVHPAVKSPWYAHRTQLNGDICNRNVMIN